MPYEPAFAPGSEPATMVEVLRRRQAELAEKRAITFLLNGVDHVATLSYRELDRRARAIAARLQGMGAAGRAVLLAFPPGLDFTTAFFGCLYARAIAVPVALKRVEQLGQMRALVDDAQPIAALSVSSTLAKMVARHGGDAQLAALPWLATDDVADDDADAWVEPALSPRDLALLQYTSGSTSAPKAVMVSHGNLIHNIGGQLRAYECSRRTIWISWLPTFHDMGLVAGTLAPVYGGFPVVAMSPLAFVKRPLVWLQAISRFRGTITVAPNFAFDSCVDRIEPAEREGLDLSSWETAVNGAEPVRASTMRRFADAFGPFGFRHEAFLPGFGLAEATLAVSAGPALEPPIVRHVDRKALAAGRVIAVDESDPRAQILTASGCPVPGQDIAIVDPITRGRCGPGRTGEIWVAGPSVTQGYWNQPEATAATFGARTADTGEGPFLRTGDLGFLDGDQLFVTGRLKDVIIIRGQNHYPQDIELVAESAHGSAIAGGTAAFAIEVEGEERLAIVQGIETRGAPDCDEIVRSVRRRVSESFDLAVYMVVLVRRRSVMRTTSGKIQRRACRSALLDLGLDVVAASVLQEGGAPRHTPGADAIRRLPQDQRQKAIENALWTGLGEILGQGVSARDPELRVDRLGLRFSSALELDARVRAELGLGLPLDLVLMRATIAQIAGHLAEDLAACGDDDRTGKNGAAATPVPRVDAGAIESWLAARVAERVGCPPSRIRRDRPFADYGLGSAEATSLVAEIERWLGVPVSPTLPWDHPSVAAAARALAAALENGATEAAQAAPAPADDDDGAIAVVGMACRFPGAPDVGAYWELLRSGRAAVTTVPASRWDADALYDPTPGTAGKLSSRWGGFLERIDEFDPMFFNISSREASRVDPQQRLLLEVAWEALEDAGRSPDRLAGSATGVFVGISSQDYARFQLHGDRTGIDAYAATGTALSIAANRLSYVLDLRGPSVAVDTACSSSLVALHQACRSLRDRDCDLAVAGGVNVLLAPELTIAFSHAHMMASDGRCKTFDTRADGYVRGEGCGVVVLRRLRDAVASRDRILAVIRGSAVQHGGRSNGLTAPNGPGQQQVIRAALADARVEPRDIGYVEAHGTGTAIGDAIEMRALGAVLGEAPEREAPCLVGSVKTNIGHLEAAAGIAGFIKVVLALGAGEIPAHLNVDEQNPALGLDARVLEIATAPRPWPGKRVAAVSSFGFGGTNAHLVVEEAPPAPPRAGAEAPLHVLCLSGRSPEALRQLAGRVAERAAAVDDGELADLCFTASASRTHQRHRLAVTAASGDAAAEALRRFAAGEATHEVVSGDARERGPARVAFLFSGQGSQHAAMGRQLHDTQPVFRAALERCADILAPHLDLPLASILFDGDASRIDDTRYTQPALVALEWSLAELWRSWGVVPDAVLGHSIGEFAAACVAGALDIEDALPLVATRGRLMASVPERGAMIAVLADADRVVRAVRDSSAPLAVAAVNGPDSVVVSGAAGAIEELHRRFEAEGVAVHPLTVSTAFHSPLIDPILDELERAAERATSRPTRIPLASNLSGALLPAGSTLDARYWRQHAREAVLFADGVRALREDGCDVFLELGPRATLVSMARRALGDVSGLTLAASLRHGQPDWQSMLASLGELFVRGVPVDFEGLDPMQRRRVVSMPTSPYERERHWFEAAASAEARAASHRERPAQGSSVSDIVALFRDQTAAVMRLVDSLEGGGIARPAPLSVPSPAPHQPAVVDPAAQVLDELSAVSGFPPRSIRHDDRIADLGFDSLMVTELRRRVQPLVPGADVTQVVAVTPQITVGEIVDRVRAAIGAGAPRPAPAPLAAPPTAPPPRRRDTGGPPEVPGDVTTWPEFAAVDHLMARVRGGGGDNPYARVHEGKNAEVAVVGGREVINYASFNYLGLSADPVVCQAAKDAVDRYGTSASATPLLLGETPLHLELESELAEILGTEAALVFASGHATNVTTIGHIVGPDDLIIHDELIHDSSVRGALLSGARRLSFPHNDHRALDATLARIRGEFRRVVVAIEGVYSQDGDIPDLPAFIDVKRRHGALLMIDEAHSIGTIGERGGGIGDHFGVERSDVDVWMGTLSKAVGSCGGYIAGSADLIKLLKHTAPGYIFATSVSPANAAAALAALRVLRMSPDRVARLQENARLFAALARQRGMDTGRSDGSPVVPIVVGQLERAIRVSEALFGRGINVMPIGYPAVPADEARLRFFVTALHTEEQLRRTVDALADELGLARPATAALPPAPAASTPTRHTPPSSKLRGAIQSALGRLAQATELTDRSGR